ncbi:MAG: HTH-type transcriptional repressor YtrA [Firmicutes bacterium ADurb.Bin506]|jgi:GntR family transcriptional regulator|nr:MAG: HTH-type transcriptional repressor YtrA [Firmicutes bacterium ADurb.Bin506]
MEFTVSPNSPTPLYQQIVDQIRARILTGELRGGDPLPSIRQLASDLLASVITTKRAYSELEAEGLIITRAGLGTFVADLDARTIEAVKSGVVASHLGAAVRVGRELGLADEQISRLFAQALARSEPDER